MHGDCPRTQRPGAFRTDQRISPATLLDPGVSPLERPRPTTDEPEGPGQRPPLSAQDDDSSGDHGPARLTRTGFFRFPTPRTGGRRVAGHAFGYLDPLVLGEIAFRPDILLAELLPRFAAGESFADPVSYSLENGSLVYAPFPNDWISTARQNYLQEILAEVAAGRLDIGIDPQTGEER